MLLDVWAGSAESNAESSTSSSTFQTKTSLTKYLVPGVYRVGIAAEVRRSGLLPNTETRAVFDGVELWLRSSFTVDLAQVNTFAFVTVASAGDKTMTIQHRALAGQSHIQNAKLELWRVD